MRILFLLPFLAIVPQDPPKPPEKLVAAFYAAKWDAEKGEGMSREGGGDGLQDHPESFKEFSYREISYHLKHLEAMVDAGIDVALCEFISHPAAVDGLVLALQSAAKNKKRIPKVAPVAADVSTALAFIGRVPPAFQASVNNRPLVWLPYARGAAPETLQSMRMIAPMFVVGDPAWKPDLAAVAGGALDGPRDYPAVTIGPGFKDGGSRVRSRDGQAWYERSWYAAMRIKPRIIAIESWNRYDEGSTICPTREHGRSLISKTKRYAEQFKKGEEIARPKGKYSDGIGVSYHLKFDPPNEGLRPVDTAVTPCEVVTVAGQKLLMAKEVTGKEGRVLAFSIDDSYAYYERREYEVQLQVMDRGKGEIVIEYDAAAPAKGETDRTRRLAEPWHYADTGDWAAATFKLPEASFCNRQEGGSDFRIVTKNAGLTVRWVQVRAK
ncbi:MAG TPA: hypothetical protein VFC86_12940 [Planctomycetota bacterium]|nr:hypothetical protein [Planctomycetota bacterium]